MLSSIVFLLRFVILTTNDESRGIILQETEQKAIEYYEIKKFAAALRGFLKLEAEEPAREEILVYIANCYDGLGQKSEAIRYYKKALKFNKKSDIAAANLAIIFYEIQEVNEAKTYARKALKINPSNPTALSMLGNISYRKKDYDAALKFYQQAMDSERDFYTAVLNAASIYYERNDFNTAYFYARKTVQAYPDSQEAQILLANICVELGRHDEALLTLAGLYEKNPKDYWYCNLLSQAFQQKKDYEKSLEMGWRAVMLSKGENSQQINFGYLLYEIAVESPGTDVLRYARKWLQKYPDNPVAKHMANAMLGAGHVNQIGSGYVRDIFDAFAEDFEGVLEDLNYEVPSLMAKTLEALSHNVKLKKMRILDAGCGTGLCGKYLKKYAKFRGLDGVDISEKMLEVARRKKLYTRIYNQDLNKFLASHENKYDLINAADVFTYFGELGGLFILLHSSLKIGGRVLFSISENSINSDDYYLHLSGRFLHGKNYVEEGLKSRGFIVEKINRVKLRNEGDEDVYGWIVMAQKP